MDSRVDGPIGLPTRAGAGRRGAAVALTLAGVATLIGSLLPWETCTACGHDGLVLFSIKQRSGVAIGAGILTAHIALLLAIAGIEAFRRGGVPAWRREATVLAASALLIVSAYVVAWLYVAPYLEDSNDSGFSYGVYVVAVASAVAMMACARMRPGAQTSADSIAPRRLPLALLVAASCVWSFAVLRHFPVRFEPLIYAVILGALAVGLWPGRLPMTSLKPPLVGVAILAYGALAVAAILVGASGFALLEATPLAVLLGIGASTIWRGLPPLDPPIWPRRLAPWGARAQRAMRSTSALLVAALGLIGVGLLLSVVRLTGAAVEVGRFWWIDPSGRAAAWPMLAAGLAVAAGIMIRLARRGATTPTSATL